MICDNDRLAGKRGIQGQTLSMPAGSPPLIGAPSFSSGNGAKTIWGLGWFSRNDQYVEPFLDGHLAWTDGSGNRTNFFPVAGSSNPPVFVSVLVDSDTRLTAVDFTSTSLRSVSVRSKYGASMLFSVAESTGLLRLSQFTDHNGNTVVYGRDNQGRLTRATDVHGRFFSLAYNGAGFVSSLSDSAGRNVSYVYDGQGHRVSETGPLGTTTYVYDSQNRMTRITYPNGGVRNYTYDSQNRVIEQDDGNGNNQTTYVYGSSFTSVTDALGRTTVYEYILNLGLRRLSRVTDPAGNVTAYSYDAKMKPLGLTDPLGRVTRFTYDGNGNVAQAVDASGASAQAGYGAAFNQPASIMDALGHQTSLSHDAQGNLTRVQDALGNAVVQSFDFMGHVTQRQDALGNSIQLSYAAENGAVASATDPLNRTTNLERDALSRVTKMTDPAGKVAQYAYNAAGDMTQATDALGGVTQYAYSPGRRKNLLASVQDALNHTTTFGYDDLGRVTSATNALNQAKTRAYNTKGNLTRLVNARGQPTTYTYDNLDRLKKKSSPEGDISYAYDAVGNLTNASHYNGSAVAATYDALNQPTQITQTLPNGFQVAIGYIYDANGNRTRMTTPWGNFSYGYDALNRLTSVTNPAGQVVAFGYDALGRRMSLVYPNGITASYAYDAAGQLLSVTHARTADQTVISSAAYAYDASGNRTSMTDGEGTHGYSYDSLNRLTSASHPAGTSLAVQYETFSYDAVGNRLSDAVRTNYTYDAANRIQSDSAFTYTNDADGNLTSKTDAATSQRTTFVYDSANRMVEVDGSSWTIATYKYDVTGLRIEKNVGGTINRYVYEMGRLVAILDGSNSLVELFTDGPGMDEPLVARKGTQDLFFHADALGNIKSLSNESGNALENYEYQAFGRPVIRDRNGNIQAQSSAGNQFSFVSREFDAETGFYYLRARFFDMDASRFMSEDPIRALNQYSFAANNPILFTDPLGLIKIQVDYTRGLLPGNWGPAWKVGFQIDTQTKQVFGVFGGGVTTSGGWSFTASNFNPVGGDQNASAGSSWSGSAGFGSGPGNLWPGLAGSFDSCMNASGGFGTRGLSATYDTTFSLTDLYHEATSSNDPSQYLGWRTKEALASSAGDTSGDNSDLSAVQVGNWPDPGSAEGESDW